MAGRAGDFGMKVTLLPYRPTGEGEGMTERCGTRCATEMPGVWMGCGGRGTAGRLGGRWTADCRAGRGRGDAFNSMGWAVWSGAAVRACM